MRTCAPALACICALAGLALAGGASGCASEDGVGAVSLALGDPAGVLDDATAIGVWAVRFYDGMPSCAEAEAFEADIVERAPPSAIEATTTVSPSSGRASLEVDEGLYAIVVEAYQPALDDPTLSEIIGVGCAEVQITGDGEVAITLRPRPAPGI